MSEVLLIEIEKCLAKITFFVLSVFAGNLLNQIINEQSSYCGLL